MSSIVPNHIPDAQLIPFSRFIWGNVGGEGVERVYSTRLKQYMAMKIVHKGVISNRENYLTLLQRLKEMYHDLHSEDISELRRNNFGR